MYYWRAMSGKELRVTYRCQLLNQFLAVWLVELAAYCSSTAALLHSTVASNVAKNTSATAIYRRVTVGSSWFSATPVLSIGP